MSELVKTDSTSLLTTSKADEIVKKCMDENISDTDVYDSLMRVIREYSEHKNSLSDSAHMQIGLESAKYVSAALRKFTRRKKALRYYYFGMYQAKIDQLFEELIKKHTISKIQEVASRKYFSQIMTILYERNVVRQCDLARELSIERANLSREMNLLILAGLVEEKKTSKLKLYNLAADGYEYCNKYFISKKKLEPNPNIGYRRLKSTTIRVELNYSEDTQNEEVQLSYLSLPEKKKIPEIFCLELPKMNNDKQSSLDETFELVEVTV